MSAHLKKVFPLKKKIDEIEKEVIVKLKTITISSIIKKEVNVDD